LCGQHKLRQFIKEQGDLFLVLVVVDGASTGWGCKLCFADGVATKKNAQKVRKTTVFDENGGFYGKCL